MGIFLSITNSSRDLSETQKFYSFTDNKSNEIIIDPTDFPTFVKTFRGTQCKKEDKQIELHNIVLEWKSCLKLNHETQEIRNKAYELIESIEALHDEEDTMLESENQKLDMLTKEKSLRDSRGYDTSSQELSEEREEIEFDEIKKEVSLRRQYLGIFNTQSTSTLKLALVDIELCQKMVDYSKDFKEIESENESSTDEENITAQPV